MLYSTTRRGGLALDEQYLSPRAMVTVQMCTWLVFEDDGACVLSLPLNLHLLVLSPVISSIPGFAHFSCLQP